MGRRAVAAILVVVAMLPSMAGCTAPGPTVLGEQDAGRVVDIGAGRQFTVRLPSNATTGFRWVVADPGPVTLIGEPVYDAPASPGVIGAGGTETFTFRTGDAGTGELKLEYRRPWEKDVPAEKSWSVTIE